MADRSRRAPLEVAALVGCGAVVLSFALHWVDESKARLAVFVSSAAALPFALTVSIRTIAWVWRGPVIVRFPLEAAALFSGSDAERVRSAAQLRGTMGGAGHLRRSRLVIPAAAWTATSAALASTLLGSSKGVTAAWAVIAVAAAIVASAFPATPFWYREARGGGVLVHPSAAWSALHPLPQRSKHAGRAVLTREPSEQAPAYDARNAAP